MFDLFNQPALDFWTASVHSREKSTYGQSHLNQHRVHFGGQNKRIFEYLMTGQEIDDDIARSWTPEIRHLHSRIADLSSPKNGFLVSRKPHPTKKLTIYFMTEEQIKFNTNLLASLSHT